MPGSCLDLLLVTGPWLPGGTLRGPGSGGGLRLGLGSSRPELEGPGPQVEPRLEFERLQLELGGPELRTGTQLGGSGPGAGTEETRFARRYLSLCLHLVNNSLLEFRYMS